MILITALIVTVTVDGLPQRLSSPPRPAPVASRAKPCAIAKNRTGNATGRS